MPDSRLKAILQECLRLEGYAVRYYSKLAESAAGEIQIFWQDMTGQEKEHLAFWKTLDKLCDENKIRNVFDSPEQVLKELRNVHDQAERLMEEYRPDDPILAFMIAFRLEFTLLNPAFYALFIMMRHETGDASPADRYHEHLQGLVMAFKKFTGPGPEWDLISDLSDQLLKRNEQIALQMAEIRQIRGLLPICMYCKNIRKDDGFWVKVESYVEEHSEAEFSHGICPDCMRKYYADYFTEEELKAHEDERQSRKNT